MKPLATKFVNNGAPRFIVKDGMMSVIVSVDLITYLDDNVSDGQELVTI
jgi:hypothetical protein